MERLSEETRTGGQYGWIALAGLVAVADLLLPETMSSAFARGMENPRTRAFVLGAWAVTSMHLLEVIPEEIDPFKQLPKRLAGVWNSHT